MLKADDPTYYYYPITMYETESGNPFFRHFIDALNKKYGVVNYAQRFSKTKMLRSLFGGLIKHRKAKVFIFNYTEILGVGKNSVFIPLYILITCLYRLCGKKFVWFFHDKYQSHNKDNKISPLVMAYNTWISNVCITFSTEGVEYAKKHFYKKANIHYIPHPVLPEPQKIDTEIEYDIFILGGLFKPYKHLVEFLQFVKNTPKMQQYKILVCGRARNEQDLAQVNENLSPKVIYTNKFATDEELNRYISASKNIIFTFDDDSVLCSASLTYCVPFGKRIIGCRRGAFLDYEKMGLSVTFGEFREIPQLLKQDFRVDYAKIESYISNYSVATLTEYIDDQLFPNKR
jgi:glycosyltransferase involved in cell wall biosynthesis